MVRSVQADECCVDKPKEEAEPKKPKFSCKRTVKEGGFPGDKACDTQTKGALKYSIVTNYAALRSQNWYFPAGAHSISSPPGTADGGCEKKQCIAGECCFAFCEDREGKTDGPPAKGEGYCDKDKDYTPSGIYLLGQRPCRQKMLGFISQASLLFAVPQRPKAGPRA